MTDPPKPLIEPNVDLRDFQFMPLDVKRLRDSTFAITADGESFRAAVLLWCAAWHQVPAGSLPDDDVVITQLAGLGRDVDAMHMRRIEILHGFVKCNDGRLYHPVICEKAKEAWVQKERYRNAARKRWKDKRKANAATHGKRRKDASSDLSKTHMQGTGTGTGTGKRKESYDQEFEIWWQHVPRKTGKGQAQRAYRTARKEADADTLVDGIKAYAEQTADRERQYVKHPATWLNGKCWLDEPDEDPPPDGGNGGHVPIVPRNRGHISEDNIAKELELYHRGIFRRDELHPDSEAQLAAQEAEERPDG